MTESRENMKRTAMFTALCILAAGALASCGGNGGSSSGTENTTGSAPAATSATVLADVPTVTEEASLTKPAKINVDSEAEDTIRSFLTAMYSSNTGDTLKYMYPDAIYKALVDMGAESAFKDNDIKGALTKFEITESSLLNPNPSAAVLKSFFEESAANNGIKLDVPIGIGKSYEVKVDFEVDIDGTSDGETVTMVATYLSGDGWKVIPFSIDDIASMLNAASNKEE
jgi:hypothetical protein